MEEGRLGVIALRNKIERALNSWQQLGCRVIRGERFFVKKGDYRRFGFHRLIFGVAKDGRAIMIYPIVGRGRSPRRICELMLDFESRGALVGNAEHIHDAYDIVVDSLDYKRKKRTFKYREQLIKYKKMRIKADEE